MYDREYYQSYYARNREKLLAMETARRSTPEAKAKRVEYYAEYYSYLDKWLSKKLNQARRRKGVFCDLQIEDLVQLWHEQEGACALTGVELTREVGQGRKTTTASLDRIDPRLGYTKGNVRFLCDAVNVMKSAMTDDELREWCRKILDVL